MIRLRDLQDWIDNLPDTDDVVVYVDEGGLTLIAENDEVMNSLEVGGKPLSEEDEATFWPDDYSDVPF